MPSSYKQLKKGMVVGFKKILRLRFKNGRNEYWDVECTKCRNVTTLHIGSIWKGAHCNECRRKETPYVNTFDFFRSPRKAVQ